MLVKNKKTKVVSNISNSYQEIINFIYGNDYEEYTGETELAYNGLVYEKGFAPKRTLQELKQAKLQEINNSYTEAVSVAKIGVPPDEVDTWEIQRLEAKMWNVDKNAKTEFCDLLAENRGIPREVLLEKVLVKIGAYTILVATATGKRQGLDDKIKLSTTKKQVEEIKW